MCNHIHLTVSCQRPVLASASQRARKKHSNLTNAMNAYPDEMESLNHAIHEALASGHFRRARDLCDRWNCLVPADPNPLSERARQLADAVDAGAFGEQRVRDVLGILADIQRSEHVRTSTTVIRSYDSPESFLYERTICAPATVASKLNWRLADQITSSADLMADPGLKFMVAFVGSVADGSNT